MRQRDTNDKKEDELQIRYAVNIVLFVLFIVFVFFFYYGITVHQQTSWDYNVPIAQNILAGEVFKNYGSNFYFYSPGSSHIFLALFLFLGLPNLFGVLGFLFLFVVSKKLGNIFGLTNYMAVMFGASICTTISVIRTVSDQSIDKWLCAWFVLSVILLEKPNKTLKYALVLGLSLGMLIGTKYSGPLFFLALIPVYVKTLLRFLNPLRVIVTSAMITFVGLFWYIRNFIVVGNPYYPAPLLFFKGYPNFTQQDWMLWKIPFTYPQAIIPLLNALISEYMIWAFCVIVIIWSLIKTYRKKSQLDSKMLRVIFLILTTGFASLLLPITPAYRIDLFHIISDMRYIHIFVLLTILAVFLSANKYKQNFLLATLTVLTSLTVFAFIPYQPKLLLISLGIFLLIFFKKPKIFQKICEF